MIINLNNVHQINVFENKEIHNCGNVEENNDLAECTAESGWSQTQTHTLETVAYRYFS